VPEFIDAPPVDVVYQFTEPALGVALKVIVPASQRDPGIVEVTVGMLFTVIVIEDVQLLLPSVTVQL
jgi:hypothetical protein